MDEQTKKAVENLIGNGAAKVAVSREVSESDFGTGGRVFVTVTLTCHQSVDHINFAADCANRLAEQRAWTYYEEARQQLEDRKLLKPRTP